MFWHSSFLLAFGYNLEQRLGSQTFHISMHGQQNSSMQKIQSVLLRKSQLAVSSPKAHFCTIKVLGCTPQSSKISKIMVNLELTRWKMSKQKTVTECLFKAARQEWVTQRWIHFVEKVLFCGWNSPPVHEIWEKARHCFLFCTKTADLVKAPTATKLLWCN